MKKLCLFFFLCSIASLNTNARQKPNVIIIYADDLGYGDVSANGATKIKTPNVDKVAAAGINFSNAHSSSATCTPSRFSILTGKYAWRQADTRIATGDAAAIIKPGTPTLPAMLQKAGYQTAAVGKWHLGLGSDGGPDWNGEIKPGPLEIGFNYCFLLPATGDRVPTVYMENRRIVNLDPNDPIQVSYKEKVGNEPTGAEHPELTTMKSAMSHDNTIINGIGRIGYMSGGKSARWVDTEIANVITNKAVDFISSNKNKPFFLYLATHDIHVPHVPSSKFLNKSGLGLRGDAILQFDWTVGEVLKALEKYNLTENTIVIVTSDNGPAIEDGYADGGYANLNGHTPGGPFRGGKYSSYEAGTRVPFIISWKRGIAAGKQSATLINQMDIYASLASLTGQKLSSNEAMDSKQMMGVLTGKSQKGRDYMIEYTGNAGFGVIKEDWKYIEPKDGPLLNKNRIELGNSPDIQLFNLRTDPGEKVNVALQNGKVVQEMQSILKAEFAKGKDL